MTIREKALALATRAHAGQKRKDGKDYITHPVAVAKIAERMIKEQGLLAETYLDDAYVLSLLHDVWEDTDVSLEEIRSEFGEYIADAVLVLSREEGETYFDFITYLGWNKDSLPIIVKLADLKHNMGDLKEGSLKDKYRFAQYYLQQQID